MIEKKTLRDLGTYHYRIVREFQDSSELCSKLWISQDSIQKWFENNPKWKSKDKYDLIELVTDFLEEIKGE